MSWLDDFLLAIRRVRNSAGENLPIRHALKFGAGFTTTDDPTRDQIVVTSSGGGGGSATIDGTCLASLEVGQVARIVDTIQGPLIVPVVPSEDLPALGIVSSKTSATACTLTLLGPVDMTVPASDGPLFVGADSYPSADLPTPPAMAQQVGFANGSGQLVVQMGTPIRIV
jgi:hypothetical protein